MTRIKRLGSDEMTVARRVITAATVAAMVAGTAAMQTTTTDTAKVADSTTAVAAAAAASGPLRLQADVSERRLTILRGDETVASYAIAVGTASDPTPRGNFSVRRVIWNPSWVPPDEAWARKKTAKGPGEKGNPMKVVKIFFREPDYYIHGTGEISSLGKAASHGCLRMAPSEAAEVARLVMEAGGAPKEESWYSRILHLRWKEHHVRLKSPVSMTITD
jgi:lipoprotein-anchoring transpeptidase ErfK/SrfK